MHEAQSEVIRPTLRVYEKYSKAVFRDRVEIAQVKA